MRVTVFGDLMLQFTILLKVCKRDWCPTSSPPTHPHTHTSPSPSSFMPAPSVVFSLLAGPPSPPPPPPAAIASAARFPPPAAAAVATWAPSSKPYPSSVESPVHEPRKKTLSPLLPPCCCDLPLRLRPGVVAGLAPKPPPPPPPRPPVAEALRVRKVASSVDAMVVGA